MDEPTRYFMEMDWDGDCWWLVPLDKHDEWDAWNRAWSILQWDDGRDPEPEQPTWLTRIDGSGSISFTDPRSR